MSKIEVRLPPVGNTGALLGLETVGTIGTFGTFETAFGFV
jgi:hypothetical protein